MYFLIVLLTDFKSKAIVKNIYVSLIILICGSIYLGIKYYFLKKNKFSDLIIFSLLFPWIEFLLFFLVRRRRLRFNHKSNNFNLKYNNYYSMANSPKELNKKIMISIPNDNESQSESESENKSELELNIDLIGAVTSDTPKLSDNGLIHQSSSISVGSATGSEELSLNKDSTKLIPTYISQKTNEIKVKKVKNKNKK